MVKLTPKRRATLRKKYSNTRSKRDVLIDIIKRKRLDLAKFTFADLNSRGKNPFINRLRQQEKRLIKEYNKLDNELNRLDRQLG